MPTEDVYVISLTGEQVDDALQQMNERIPEGWAVGTKDGVPVPSTSPFYHNNAKYWAEQAHSQSGVTSFNGRTGTVTPQSGDYTAAMVGALASNAIYVSSFNGRSGIVRPQSGDYTAAMVGALAVTDRVIAGRREGSSLGNMATAEGVSVVASGMVSHAEGAATEASGDYSHAEGGGVASGDYSHAEGNGVASEEFSHAEGNAQATGVSAHAEGAGTASGEDSHAEGVSSASGEASHSEGYGLASGKASHAEGDNSQATGDYSHSEGSSEASGKYSHAEGRSTVSEDLGSHSEGYGTVAAGRSQHVFGEYNVIDRPSTAGNKGVYIEIVGKGTSQSARSNARTLDWNGNEVLAGKLTVGTAPTANMDVTTKQYVDDAISNAIGVAISGSY